MNRVAYRMELKKKRAEEIRKNKVKLAIFLLLVVFIWIGISLSLNAKANENTFNVMNKQNSNTKESYIAEVRYTKHQVAKGSNLWAIAMDISFDLDLSIMDTIKLVKEINNLTSDELYEGQCILIPYIVDQSLCA